VPPENEGSSAEIAEALVRDSTDAMAAFDRDLRVVAWNPAMERFVGVPSSEVLGKRLPDAARDSDRLRELVADWPTERVLAGDTVLAEGRVHARPDGSRATCDWRYSPVRDRAGATHHGLAVARDVTDRYEVERRAAELDAVFKALNDRCVRVGTDGLIHRLLAGYPAYVLPERVIGKRVRDILDAEDASRVEAALAEVNARSRPVSVEYDVTRADGEHHLEARLVPFGEGEVIAVLRDVSDRYRAEVALRESEERLRAAQKMEAIGRLAGGVSHDFNNLLTVLLNCTELLARGMPPQAPGRPYVAEIQSAIERGAALTQQLLAFSRKQPAQLRVFDLSTAVEDVQTMLRRLIGEHIELVTKLEGGPLRVRADRGQVEHVLVNLVVNARDALGDRGGRITTITRTRTVAAGGAADVPPGRYAVLVVKDDGAGMTDEVKSHVFEPFFTTKPRGKGTGLGLATVYGIVKQSGGHVSVRSSPGAGTEVEVLLPAVDHPVSASVPAARPPARPGGDETIVVVEDEPTLRRIVCEILAGSGYRVHPAENPEDALAVCAELVARGQSLDLLLSDVVMPGMGGRELAALVRQRYPRARVLLMSGYDESGGVEGGDLIIGKPFTATALATRVREVLD
jgi:PAS domain S-box-containing protein